MDKLEISEEHKKCIANNSFYSLTEDINRIKKEIRILEAKESCLETQKEIFRDYAGIKTE